jgi:hypothetical protein
MFQHALGLRNQALTASVIAAAIFAWPGVATFYYFAGRQHRGDRVGAMATFWLFARLEAREPLVCGRSSSFSVACHARIGCQSRSPCPGGVARHAVEHALKAICNADQSENHRGLQVGADGSRLARSACHVRG